MYSDRPQLPGKWPQKLQVPFGNRTSELLGNFIHTYQGIHQKAKVERSVITKSSLVIRNLLTKFCSTH